MFHYFFFYIKIKEDSNILRKPKKPKYSLQKVKEIINSKEHELITFEYLGVMQKLTTTDKEGYLYYVTLNNFQISDPKKFHISNIYTLQNIKLWCKLNNKPFELISNTYNGAIKDLNWRCLVDGCNEYFEMSLDCITRTKMSYGCPYCSNHRAGLSNCLATKNPQVASEWHPTKNGELTPYNVVCGSDKEVWWQCKDNPKHEWKVRVASRSDSGCPYCSHNLPSEDYNLMVINPKICEEWNYNKNNKNPEEYCPNSSEYVWWKCNKCNHEWTTTIGHRNNGTCCPECNESKGEKECRRVFDLKTVNYISQKEFDGLLGLGGGNLSYDFYIPKYNLLIEYQGNFHDGTARGYSREDFAKQQEHDRRKREYAQNNNMKLLEIWYWDFDKIEKILSKELK